jgi:hypothetical protein
MNGIQKGERFRFESGTVPWIGKQPSPSAAINHFIAVSPAAIVRTLPSSDYLLLLILPD